MNNDQGLTITLSGPVGCGKTQWAEYLRKAQPLLNSLPTPLIVEASNAPGEPQADSTRGDLTLRELQTCLPWTVRYSSDFRATPLAHKDFAHGLTHVLKAAGMLAALVDDMDHRKEVADDPAIHETHAKYVADLVVCALRMANTFPGGVLDLQRAVEDRLEGKNAVKLPRPGR